MLKLWQSDMIWRSNPIKARTSVTCEKKWRHMARVQFMNDYDYERGNGRSWKFCRIIEMKWRQWLRSLRRRRIITSSHFLKNFPSQGLSSSSHRMFQLFFFWPHRNGSLNVVILELVFAFDHPSNQTNVKWVDPIPQVPAVKATLKKKKMVPYNMIKMGAETRKKERKKDKVN